MSKELLEAVITHAKSDTTLYNYLEQSGDIKFGMFYNLATPEATTPFCIFDIESPSKMNKFCGRINNNTLTFKIYDDSKSPSQILDIGKQIISDFDRATLSYSTKEHVGCILESENNPIRIEDCWVYLINFNVLFSE